MKKRMFALVLALCLMLTMIPVPAFAEGEKAGDTVVTQEPVATPESAKKEEPVTTTGVSGKTDEPEKIDESGKTDEPEKTDESGKTDEPEKTDESGKTDEPEKTDESGKTDEPAEPTPVQKVQSLIDALPEASAITAETREAVEAQLTAIDQAKALLEGDVDTLNTGKYDAAVAALHALDGMPGAEVPKTLEVQSLAGAAVSVKTTFRYNGNPQTLGASDVTVELDGTTLTAGTDYTLTAAAQTIPGSYPFTVTGTGNYTGTASGIWNIDKGQLSGADKNIYIKVKNESGASATIDVAARLPGLKGGSFTGSPDGEGLSIDYNATTITVRVNPHQITDSCACQITFNSETSYYEQTQMMLHILVVDSNAGDTKTLTVNMNDWEEGDEPNQPTVTGLPDVPYNYQVTYNKRGETTALSAVPTEAGAYSVTVTCEDSENNTYSGSAIFTVWKKYTITFDPNGGQLPDGASATTTTKNGKLNGIPDPTRDGYVFRGWYDADGNIAFVGKVFKSDTTFVARWEKEVTSLAFTLTGYGYKEIVKDTKLTQANEGIKDVYTGYGVNYGICAKDGNTLTSDNTFSADKTYYVFVKFFVEEDYNVWYIDKNNVRLNGIPAMNIEMTDEAAGMEWMALFALPTIHTIDINCGKNGSISYGDTTYKGAKTVTVGVLHGENATFTITPNKGYSRSKLWIDGDQQTKTAKEYTFKEVSDSKHTLKATFAKASDNPKTGDESHVDLALDAMFIAAGALAAMLILSKKKKGLKK